jgi:hypothetical protein
MSRDTHPLVLLLLLALGCSLVGGTAEAAYRSAPPQATARCTANWLTQLLGHLPFGAGKNGIPVDPNGYGCPKSGGQVDPNGQPAPNKNGGEFDPNGGGPTKP